MSTPPRFLKKEAISFGWRTVTGNLWFFVLLAIIVLAIGFIPQLLGRIGKEVYAFVPLIALALWVLQIFVQLGIVKIALKFCDGGVGTIPDLFSQGRLFFRYLGASILYGLVVGVGFLLLIVPGIVWGIKFGLFSYVLVDKNLGVVASLKESARLTQGSKGNLFLLGLLLALVNFVGVIALGVGLFVTVPITMIASAFAYRKLSVAVQSPAVPAENPSPVTPA